jgi:hypothetical protein
MGGTVAAAVFSGMVLSIPKGLKSRLIPDRVLICEARVCEPQQLPNPDQLPFQFKRAQS